MNKWGRMKKATGMQGLGQYIRKRSPKISRTTAPFYFFCFSSFFYSPPLVPPPLLSCSSKIFSIERTEILFLIFEIFNHIVYMHVCLNVCKTVRLASQLFQRIPSLPLEFRDYKREPCLPGIYVGAGPHTCMASALSTKPSPHS